MKVRTIEDEAQFVPFTVEIRIESPQEAMALWEAVKGKPGMHDLEEAFRFIAYAS